MVDPREIEGSPERAADKGRQEDLGLEFGSKPSLGDPSVVGSMVSLFAHEVVETRKDYNLDKLSSEQAQERVRELAREYGRIVMGRDSRYAALPWNDPARLGRRIKLVVPAESGIDDPGELLFLNVGASIMSIAAAHEREELSDAEAKSKAQEILEDVVSLILGLR